jgi:hypothetical protein
MSYATGQTIAAADYNGIAQTTVGGNVAFVLGTGYGQFGYGQSTTGIATVSSTGIVTATQWAGLIYLINRALGHQSGVAGQLATGSNIGIVSGATVAAYANVATAATTINKNKALWSAQGTTTTGTVFYSNITVGTNAFSSNSFTRTITFPSGDAARYFFNGGGQISFTFAGTTNIGAATTRSSDIINLFRNTLVGGNIRATTGSAIQGTGNTAIVNATTIGYFTANVTPYQLANVQSTATSYTTDYANVRIQMSAPNTGLNGDNGTTITLMYGLFSAPRALNFNADLSVAISCRIDIVEPETTYLTKSWTNPSIA